MSWLKKILNNVFQFAILILMLILQRKIYSIVALIVYTISLTFIVSPHYDVDSSFGSGDVQLTSHNDANNCKHINLSHIEHCVLCSVNSGRAFITSNLYSFEPELYFSDTNFTSSSSLPFSADLSSISPRGPPVTLS